MAKYRSYHGRSRKGVSVLLAVLLIFVIGVGLFYFAPDYLIYTEDGGVYLDLPFLRRATPSPSEEIPPVNVVVITPSPSPLELPGVSASPEPQTVAVKALFVPMEKLKDPTGLDGVKNLALAAGISRLVLAYKDESGETVDPDVLAEAMNRLGDPSLTLVAHISACLDNKVTRSKQAFGLKVSSGVNWIDGNRNRWINLHVPEARQYIIEGIQSAKEAGFEEVMLDNLSFPVYGSLSKLDFGQYASVSHTSAVNTFLEELSAWLGSVPVSSGGKKSFTLTAQIMPETAADGFNLEAGQQLERFQAVFDELYVSWDAEAAGPADGMIAVLDAGEPEDILREKMRKAAGGWLIYSKTGEYPIGAFDQ